MRHQSAYFMHDQARHRVARLMAGPRRSPLSAPVWPLLALVAALTVVNVVTALPPL